MKQLRVVVVDDSSVFRSALAEAIQGTGLARVVAHGSDGKDGLAKVDTFRPDVVTLDLEMPVMGGLEALAVIRERYPDVAVIVISSLHRDGARASLQALTAGALEVVVKPSGGDAAANRAALAQHLGAILLSLARGGTSGATPVMAEPRVARKETRTPQIVAIGSSTGGPNALSAIIPRLPGNLPVPVVIAQHMPPLFTAQLAETLDAASALTVREGAHGDLLKPGHVYIAPGGRHMRVSGAGNVRHVEITDDPPENHCRPAVDYLFRSVAELYPGASLGVILTGIGADGTAGLREMHKHPIKVIGQDEATCTVYGMPRAAKNAGLVDLELPLNRIADAIVSAVGAR